MKFKGPLGPQILTPELSFNGCAEALWTERQTDRYTYTHGHATSYIAKLSPNSSFSWAVLVLISAYPTGRQADRPTGIVLKLHDRAKLRKQKLLVYMRRPQNSF